MPSPRSLFCYRLEDVVNISVDVFNILAYSFLRNCVFVLLIIRQEPNLQGQGQDQGLIFCA